MHLYNPSNGNNFSENTWEIVTNNEFTHKLTLFTDSAGTHCLRLKDNTGKIVATAHKLNRERFSRDEVYDFAKKHTR